jgi:hypothetical protein
MPAAHAPSRASPPPAAAPTPEPHDTHGREDQGESSDHHGTHTYFARGGGRAGKPTTDGAHGRLGRARRTLATAVPITAPAWVYAKKERRTHARTLRAEYCIAGRERRRPRLAGPGTYSPRRGSGGESAAALPGAVGDTAPSWALWGRPSSGEDVADGDRNRSRGRGGVRAVAAPAAPAAAAPGTAAAAAAAATDDSAVSTDCDVVTDRGRPGRGSADGAVPPRGLCVRCSDHATGCAGPTSACMRCQLCVLCLLCVSVYVYKCVGVCDSAAVCMCVCLSLSLSLSLSACRRVGGYAPRRQGSHRHRGAFRGCWPC